MATITATGRPRTEIQIVDASRVSRGLPIGVCAMFGETLKGTALEATLISTWTEFEEKFGGLSPYLDSATMANLFPLYCQRALEAGASLQVVKVPSPATAVLASDAVVTVSANVLTLTSNLRGAIGNSIRYTFVATATGTTFTVYLGTADKKTFIYTQEFPVPYTQADLDTFNANNSLATLTFVGTAPAFPTTPGMAKTDEPLTLGVAGTYTPTEIRTALAAVDSVEAMDRICWPDDNTRPLQKLVSDYARDRADVWAILRAPTTLTGDGMAAFAQGDDYTGTATAYAGAPFNTEFSAIMAGALTIRNPNGSGDPAEISPVGDIVGKLAVKDVAYAPWYSTAGGIRGRFANVLGTPYNLQSRGLATQADNASNAGVNYVGQDSVYGVYLWGNSTTKQPDPVTGSVSALSQLNVSELVLETQRRIRRATTAFAFDPTLPDTWFRLGSEITGILDDILANNGILEYRYQGDQDATNSADTWIVNRPEDVSQGLYRALLEYVPVAAMRWVCYQLTIQNSTVNLTPVT